MSEEDQFDRLMDIWEDARKQGQTISAGDLCRDYPELLRRSRGRSPRNWIGMPTRRPRRKFQKYSSGSGITRH